MRQNLIITDPIHQVMNYGSDEKTREAIKKVLQSKCFQRLRRISQLGMASFVFPGATHTRFSHSLGVACLARDVLSHLIEREEDKRQEIKLQRRNVILAALLHDIGHGPFSHSFERVLLGQPFADEPPLHEDWTRVILTHPDSELVHKLQNSPLDIDLNDIASIFSSTPGESKIPLYLQQVVSSQLDADRLDYLVRDAHFSGVEIGRIDVQYLIHCMSIIRNAEGRGEDHLGLVHKGIKAYETFAFARYLMNRSVYLHKAVAVLQFMMEELMRQIITSMATLKKIKDLAPVIPAYLKAISDWDSKQKDQNAFMHDHLMDYLNMTESSVWNCIESISVLPAGVIDTSLQLMANKLLRRDLLRSFVVAHDKSVVQKVLKDFPDSAVQVISSGTTMYKPSSHQVYVMEKSGGAHEISTVSEILSKLKDSQETESLVVVLNEKLEEDVSSALSRL